MAPSLKCFRCPCPGRKRCSRLAYRVWRDEGLTEHHWFFCSYLAWHGSILGYREELTGAKEPSPNRADHESARPPVGSVWRRAGVAPLTKGQKEIPRTQQKLLVQRRQEGVEHLREIGS